MNMTALTSPLPCAAISTKRMRQICLVLLLALPAIAQAGAGRIQFVSGDVRVVNAAGQERAAKKGEDILEGDTIVTSKASAAQIRMSDGGFMAVRPETKLKIDTFRYAGKTDGSEKGSFTLLKGTFRAITGAVGSVNKANYEVRTPGATIGIRGTDHEPMFIPQPLAGEIPVGTPGTYDKVNVGAATIKTQVGTILVAANHAGYAANENSAPVKLQHIPGFFKPVASPASLQGNGGATQTTSQSSTASGESTTTTATNQTATTADSTGSTSTATSTLGTTSTTTTSLASTTTTSTITQNVTTTGGTINFSTTGTTTQTAPLWSGGVGADMWINSATNMVESGSGGIIVDGQPGRNIQIGANGEMVSVSDTNINGGSFQFSAGTATLTASNSMILNDNAGNPIAKISWGRWDGGYAVIDQGILKNSVNSFQYMYSPNLTPMTSLPITGSLNYSIVPGTGVIMDGSGQMGSVTSMALAVNFGAALSPSAVTYSINATTPGKTWNGQGSGSVNDLLKNNIILSGTCSGGGCSGSAASLSGKATGLFLGSAAQAAISSFNLSGKDTAGNIVGTANGVGALKCTGC